MNNYVALETTQGTAIAYRSDISLEEFVMIINGTQVNIDSVDSGMLNSALSTIGYSSMVIGNTVVDVNTAHDGATVTVRYCDGLYPSTATLSNYGVARLMQIFECDVPEWIIRTIYRCVKSKHAGKHCQIKRYTHNIHGKYVSSYDNGFVVCAVTDHNTPSTLIGYLVDINGANFYIKDTAVIISEQVE